MVYIFGKRMKWVVTFNNDLQEVNFIDQSDQNFATRFEHISVNEHKL